jgi:hypothetical protein
MLLLCYKSDSYRQKLDLGSIERFLVYSASGALFNVNTIVINSSFKGDINAITGFGAISTPGSSVPYDNGNLENKNALTVQAKVDLLNPH